MAANKLVLRHHRAEAGVLLVFRACASATRPAGASMSASMGPVSASLSFRRVVDVPFETCVAALDSWQRTEHGGELRSGAGQVPGPMQHDPESGTCRIEIRLARGPLRPPRRMRLDIDRWSASSTALELIPCGRVRPPVRRVLITRAPAMRQPWAGSPACPRSPGSARSDSPRSRSWLTYL